MVLSNAPTFLARAVERLDELGFVDTFLFSCDLGVAKPDRAAFRHALRSLGLPSKDCTFLDDRAENVAAARALGIHARRVTHGERGMKKLRTRQKSSAGSCGTA